MMLIVEQYYYITNSNMKSIIIYLSIIGTFACWDVEGKHINKRQIYREQVTPHAGGKIPDSAFHVDRLALNKLQKEGIAIPDGYQLEPREFQVYPYNQKTRRPTFHAALKPSNRYTPSVGEYHFNGIPSVETTYAIPQISGHPVNLPPKMPAIPVLTNALKIPTHYNVQQYPQQSYQIVYNLPQKFQHPAGHQQSIVYPQSRPLSLLNTGPLRQQHPYIGTGPVQSLLDRPLNWPNFDQNYITSALFNDFEHFFKDYAHQHRAPQFSQRGIRDLNKETKTPKSNVEVENSKNKN